MILRNPSKESSTGIRRAWRGQEKLWKVFWLYGTLPMVVTSIFSRYIMSRYALSMPAL